MKGQIAARVADKVGRFSSVGKEHARHTMTLIALETEAEAILELWGGGGWAREIRSRCPSATVMSAESDASLWLPLTADSATHGYLAHCGDVADVKGRFDLIWLDLCSQMSGKVGSLLRSMRAKLVPGGVLGITVLAARDGMTNDDRLALLPLWLERQTGMHVNMIFRYVSDGGSPMWLVVLMPRRKKASRWASASFADEVSADLTRWGFWGLRRDGLRDACAVATQRQIFRDREDDWDDTTDVSGTSAHA